MKRIALLFALVSWAMSPNSGRADDGNPPSWRGQEHTTYQKWTFGTEANPTGPDSDYYNPIGTATLTVGGTPPYRTWLAENNGHTGVWRFDSCILVDIPDYGSPHDCKEIWMQITYCDTYGANPVFLTSPDFRLLEMVNKAAVDNYYWHLTCRVTIEPNPGYESIIIQPRCGPLYVDELVIDTVSRVPEPTTVFLLSLGALLLLLRKRGA